VQAALAIALIVGSAAVRLVRLGRGRGGESESCDQSRIERRIYSSLGKGKVVYVCQCECRVDQRYYACYILAIFNPHYKKISSQSRD
jgi:hypothetical protein